MGELFYNGKRTARHRAPAAGRQRNDRRRTGGTILGRLLFFPAALFYLELVLHISAGMSLKFFPIYLLLGGAFGLLLGAVSLPFPPKVNNVLSKVLCGVLCLAYAAELVAKKILQTFYPLSALKTAAGNRLEDYSDVIFSTILRSLPQILLLFLPLILLCLLGRRYVGYRRYGALFAGVVALCAVAVHLVGLGLVHLPWSGDMTPKQLYQMDTNFDDQVEQLGALTMLRLDVKHMIVPAKADLDDDFSGLNVLGGKESPSPTPDASPDPSASPTPVIDRSPNVLDVDLETLAASGKNEDIRWLAEYFNSVAPTNKNEYTGMFKGYNVIQIVMEGFSGYAIDPQLTPTLYKLTHEGFVFNNFYTALHFTSTSNGECQTMLGLYPKNGFPITMTETGKLGTYLPLTLPQLLKKEGYNVLAFHPNSQMYGRYESHTNLGYDYRQFGNGFDNMEVNDSGKLLWPQRDSYMVEASVDEYINSDKPFHVYYLTISGHMPYSDNRVVAPYRETVRALPYSETTQNYVATAMEVDKMLATLIEKLRAAGKLDKTLIVATGDHIPYFNVDTLEELTGKKFGSSEDLQNINEKNIDFDVYKNALILWTPGMTEPVTVDKVCCQVDILPTLANLLGLPYDSRMLDGTDILSESEGLVVFSSRCWKSDRGFYNRFTGEFTPAAGVSMTPEEQESYVSTMKKLVSCRLESTDLIVENNFYAAAFGDDRR